MTEITGTLTQLKNEFKDWHNKDEEQFNNLHTLLVSRMNTLETNRQSDTQSINNNFFKIATLFSAILNGSTSEVNDETTFLNIIKSTPSINLQQINQRLTKLDSTSAPLGDVTLLKNVVGDINNYSNVQ